MFHYKIIDRLGEIVYDSSLRKDFEGYYSSFYAYIAAVWNIIDVENTICVSKIDVY